MTGSHEWTFEGRRGEVVVRVWPHPAPRYVALLVHGYGEHIGRYEWVAGQLHAHGAEVVGPDHLGHGRSAGERVLVESYDDVVADLRVVGERAGADRPDLPVVLIGHSMGGMIAAYYAQRYGAELAALVLSGPVLGSWAPTALADAPEIPDEPLDISTLSRDPEVGARYAADPLVWHGPFKRPTLRAMATCMGRIDGGARLVPPTLWAHGAEDQLVPIGPSREGVERIAGEHLEVRVYPGARHEIFNETNAVEVLRDLTGFVDRSLPGG